MMKLFKKLLAVAMVAVLALTVLTAAIQGQLTRMLFTPMMRQKVLFMH